VIVELAQKTRLPATCPSRSFVEDGGLTSYGMDLSALLQRLANIVDQILKGGKPRDIPVFQPTKFELAINLRTAKSTQPPPCRPRGSSAPTK
jgi:putative tryptophan/tyrosine transport system substrate-binding protein